jgi:hypothetical protein
MVKVCVDCQLRSDVSGCCSVVTYEIVYPLKMYGYPENDREIVGILHHRGGKTGKRVTNRTKQKPPSSCETRRKSGKVHLRSWMGHPPIEYDICIVAGHWPIHKEGYKPETRACTGYCTHTS